MYIYITFTLFCIAVETPKAGKAIVCDEIQSEMLKALNRGVVWLASSYVSDSFLQRHRNIGKLG